MKSAASSSIRVDLTTRLLATDCPSTTTSSSSPLVGAQIQAAAVALGLHLPQRALGQFETYIREIGHWRERINLVPGDDPSRLAGLHLVDALLALTECEFPHACRVVDIGSGAGLPGIPLKILRPDLRVTLVEASRRRVGFLEHVRSVLGLADVDIEWTRAEAIGRREDRRERYDRSVERATGRLAVAAELCLPLVRPGGAAVFLKGQRVLEEMDRAVPLVAALGGQIAQNVVRPLPTTERQRAIVVINKVTQTPSRYPRSSARQGRAP